MLKYLYIKYFGGVFMSPIALKLLTKAYENYKKTGDTYFEYLIQDSESLIYDIAAVRQLYNSGYIEEVSDFVFSNNIPNIFSRPITFTLKDIAIEYMTTRREL